MKEFVFLFLVLASLPACAVNGDRASLDEKLEATVNRAFQEGDFDSAIDLSLPRASMGDPEFQFSVGYLEVMWLEAPSPKELPRYSLEEAMSWIRKAAAQNLPQAAGFLRSGYEWGRYALPKKLTLEDCWRKVESADQHADVCIAAEKKIFSLTGDKGDKGDKGDGGN